MENHNCIPAAALMKWQMAESQTDIMINTKWYY